MGHFAPIFIIHLLNFFLLWIWSCYWDTDWDPVVQNLVINILLDFVQELRALVLCLFFFVASHSWGHWASIIIVLLLLFLLLFVVLNLPLDGQHFHSSVLILVPVDTLAGLHIVVGAHHINDVGVGMRKLKSPFLGV